jgi:hypothetical protein
MSGYLARLALGARSPADAHPRWVSPYEGISVAAVDAEPLSLSTPVAHSGGSDSFSEVVVRPAKPEQSAAPLPPHREPDATVRRPAVESSGSPAVGTKPRIAADRVAVEQAPADSAGREAPAPAIAPLHEPRPGPLVKTSRPRLDPDHASAANQISGAHLGPDTETPPPAAHPQAVPRPLRRSFTPPRADQPALPEVVRAAASPPARAAAAPPTTRVTESAGPRSIVRAAAERAPAAPTVVVTIGRLEVRAASPPPPTPRPRSGPVPMSLDAYLTRLGERKP